MAGLAAFNLQQWIDDNRDLLKPPVGNARLVPEGDFIVMAIGGPNLRVDYHDDPGEELFYQVEGDMVLRIMENGVPRDVPIREGEMLLLPARVRHSPQRPEGTVGIVVERVRRPGEEDGFDWYCEKCHALVFRRTVELKSIYDDLPPIFDLYYGDSQHRTCPECGHVNKGKDE